MTGTRIDSTSYAGVAIGTDANCEISGGNLNVSASTSNPTGWCRWRKNIRSEADQAASRGDRYQNCVLSLRSISRYCASRIDGTNSRKLPGLKAPNKNGRRSRLKPLLRYRITEEKHNQDMLQKP